MQFSSQPCQVRTASVLFVVVAVATLVSASVEAADTDSTDAGHGEFVDAPEVAGLMESVPAKSNKERGIRAEDRDAYFAVLDWLADADREQLLARAIEHETLRRQVHDRKVPHLKYSAFADWLNNPDWWQGKAVHIVGHANRVVSYDPGPNTLDLTSVYEAWVVSDSSLRYPAVVVTRSIPTGVPIGESDAVGVDVTGIFFQLFTYKARDGETRYAPLILADRWSIPEPKKASREAWWLAALSLLFGVTSSITLVRSMSRSPRRRVGIDPNPSVFPDDFSDDESAPDHASTPKD